MKITLWDILTIIIILIILLIGLIYTLIFINPNAAINPLPPVSLPPTLDIKLATSTATLRSLPATWTPEGGIVIGEDGQIIAGGPTLRPTRTYTPSKTPIPSNTLPPTRTVSLTASRTIDPTLITYTPTPTPSRTPTLTLDAAASTSKAKTAFAEQTAEARAEKTQSAQETKDAYNQALTEQALANQQTQDAYTFQLTQQSVAQTQTAAPALTAAAAQTQTQAALDATATSAQAATNAQATSVQATANATATMIVQATQVQEAPIAISIDLGAGGAPYEEIHTHRLVGGGGWPKVISLAATFPAASEISSWWLDDTLSLWYLMFSDSTVTEPLNLVHYLDAATNFDIDTPAGTHTHPIVTTQSGAASSRWVIFTRAELGPGNDRNLWRIRGDGTGAVSLSDNADFDDHDPFWTPDGQILYAGGPAAGADNIYLLTPGDSPPGTQLTYYTGVVEIASPKWCRSWDWTNEVWIDTVVFARRTGPAAQWDLFTANPSDWGSTLTNITNTGGANETDPDWSPYCERIVYVNNSPQPDVWHMARNGSDIQQLTNDANAEVNPLWQPVQ